MSAVLPGLCSVTFRELEPEAIIDLAAEAGIVGIEWGADVHIEPARDDRARDVAARCSDAGVSCASYGTYLGARRPIVDRDEVLAACTTAQALGAPNLRIWTPVRRGVRSQSAEITAAERAEIAAGVALAASTAADFGLTIGVEYHAWTLTETTATATELIDAVDAPNLYLYWQPLYWHRPADTRFQIDEAMATLPHLSHLHVYWWEDESRRVDLAAGADVWEPVISAAGQAKGRWAAPRYAFMEFVADDDPVQFRRDAATLLGWLAA